MALFWEIAATSVYHICSLCISSILLVVLVISRFDFKDRILVLVVPVPGHCLLLTFLMTNFIAALMTSVREPYLMTVADDISFNITRLIIFYCKGI